MWDRLEEFNEGVSTRRDTRADVILSHFNCLKRLENEYVQDAYDRLLDISNELEALSARDVTDHEVAKELLRSLDGSFHTLALMIQ